MGALLWVYGTLNVILKSEFIFLFLDCHLSSIQVKKERTKLIREKNLTKMTIFVSVKSFFGSFIYSIVPMLFTLGLKTSIYNIFILFGNTFVAFSSSLNFFIYLTFNNAFYLTFKSLIFKKTCLKFLKK